jgi:glyoxylase-like metal-dependent hydrolase (beta-lactamase superfamily II)
MTPRGDATGAGQIAADVYCLPVRGANVSFVGYGSAWVLIDAGWSHQGPAIRRAAEDLFGPNARPEAILLTHAHPDHEGSALELARLWDLPVYVHPTTCR